MNVAAIACHTFCCMPGAPLTQRKRSLSALELSIALLQNLLWSLAIRFSHKSKIKSNHWKKLRGTLNTQTQRYALKTECHPRHHVQNSEDRDKYINDKARKCHAGDCTLVSSSCGQPQGELHPDVRAPTHGWMVSVAMYAGGMKLDFGWDQLGSHPVAPQPPLGQSAQARKGSKASVQLRPPEMDRNRVSILSLAHLQGK